MMVHQSKKVSVKPWKHPLCLINQVSIHGLKIWCLREFCIAVDIDGTQMIIMLKNCFRISEWRKNNISQYKSPQEICFQSCEFF